MENRLPSRQRHGRFAGGAASGRAGERRHERHDCRHRGGAPHHRRAGAAHADAAGPQAVRAHRRRGLRQVRKPPGHQLVQGARRAQQARLALGCRARPRRHRHVGRQPRPGGRLSRRPAADSGHHRDAGDHAVREGGGDAGAWRRGGARRREHRRRAGPRRDHRARARPHLGSPLRRRPRDRRAGHHRARNAGGDARSRHAGDPDRRRRPDRRQCGGGAGGQPLDRDHRRRGCALSVVLERR